jgi:hypothetical protein
MCTALGHSVPCQAHALTPPCGLVLLQSALQKGNPISAAFLHHSDVACPPLPGIGAQRGCTLPTPVKGLGSIPAHIL